MKEGSLRYALILLAISPTMATWKPEPRGPGLLGELATGKH